jgi:uncharacterized membrane protein YdjX (TVP38/TMEM64 family)
MPNYLRKSVTGNDGQPSTTINDLEQATIPLLEQSLAKEETAHDATGTLNNNTTNTRMHHHHHNHANNHAKKGGERTCSTRKNYSKTMQTIGVCVAILMVAYILWHALDDSWPGLLLVWVQAHPLQGLVLIVAVLATCVILLLPIGTPLTIGCGYIYKSAYGWKLGLSVATLVSMTGSLLGAVTCFVLGRYFMRRTVQTWAKRYPLFDAIDVAAHEHGLRIMAMLYLTPILPLGVASYMCGTTSMKLHHFCLAKIASLPLFLFYVFLGASMGALIGTGDNAAAELKQVEENQTLIVIGIVLSFAMVSGITYSIRKELNTVRTKSALLFCRFLIPDTN